MKNIRLKKQQIGAETFEFLVVFLFFMMFIMAVFDFSRALYVWNSLTEATRRGARMAVVCPNDAASQTIIRNVAVFDDFAGSLGSSPVIKGLTPGAIDITYRNADGDLEVTDTEIAFAEVAVNTNYKFEFIIPGLQQFVEVPAFKTTLYSESKGAVPTLPGEATADPACNF